MMFSCRIVFDSHKPGCLRGPRFVIIKSLSETPVIPLLLTDGFFYH
jgi:hypothetical protein